VNFTFIRTVEKIQDVNFSIFTVPVVEALKKLGVEAYTTGRNDLLIDGKKISGNAEHVHKNRVLHHGTLLYNSQLETLKGALKADLSRFEDKAVQSNRSEVTNIAGYMSSPISVEEFTGFIFGEISQSFPDFRIYQPTPEDLKAIEKLSIEKYQTWEWIFGYSPRYRFTGKLESENGDIHTGLLVEHGLLAEVSVSGAIQPGFSKKIAEILVGCRHEYETVKSALGKLENEFQQNTLSVEELTNGLF
jgi:lipoate-protein ligase A